MHKGQDHGFGRATAVGGLLLLGATMQSANANSEYDDTSLNGNLQHQCTSFSANLDTGNSLTISAECNKRDAAGGVGATRRSTSFDLSDHVVWNSETQKFVWDTAANSLNNITLHCVQVRGFAYSATNVTLQLTCVKDTGRQGVSSSDGSVSTVDADLGLNGKLTVGSGGRLKRR